MSDAHELAEAWSLPNPGGPFGDSELAELAAQTLAGAYLDLRAQIAALTGERDDLKMLLDMWAEGYPDHCNWHGGDAGSGPDCLLCNTRAALHPQGEP